MSGLSMNILCTAINHPCKGFFSKISEGDLLPVSGWAVNFLNFVIIYIFKCKSQWYIEEWHFTELEMVKY